jgi:hypothetical protein
MASLVTGEDAHLPSLDLADAVVEILMRALTPETENKRS